MVSAWLEPPSARPAERCAGVRDGILQAFAFGTTETPPEVTFLKGRRLRSVPFLLLAVVAMQHSQRGICANSIWLVLFEPAFGC